MARPLVFARVLFLFASGLATLPAAVAQAAEQSAPKIEGGYAVVVSKQTAADEGWGKVVAALKEKYAADVIQYDGNVAEAREPLSRLMPRYACFVARPEEANRQFVISVHRLTRRLNDDPYTDVIWGILTGYDSGDALKTAELREPLIIHKGAGGTSIPLDRFDAGVWYSESEKGAYFEKPRDAKPEKKSGPADSTQALVDTLNTFKPDLFLTSGHATERDWQIGYSYRNGQFRSKDGVVTGIDLAGKRFPVESPNPKVYLACGNCLMGNIPDRGAMALAFMHSAGVRQMCGYVVSTWYGYSGWGVRDYFVDQPGRFSLAEAAFINNQALVQNLQSRFPKGAAFDNDKWNIETDPNVLPAIAERLGYKQWNDDVKDHVGLVWDRDTLAFYGDPAWEARLAPRDSAWEQSLTEKDGVYTFEVKPRDDVSWSRPPAAILPRRVKNPQIVSGQEYKPTVGELFVMLAAPAKLEKGKTYTVVFRAGDAKQAKDDAAKKASSDKSSGDDEQSAAVVKLLPAEFQGRVTQALAAAGANSGELLSAIRSVPAEHRPALAFLLAHMPRGDLRAVKADFLLENVDYAYRAWHAAPWSKDTPDEIFLNSVLPYANVNERRDNWRKDFYEKFGAAVKDCRTPGEAAQILNKAVFEKTGVAYHATKRPKPDQSPYESIDAHYASCTGLSILLVDACRAVGVPARVVGTQWTKTPGNHTWVEIWDREWKYVGAAEPGPFNKTWFTGQAADADATQPDKRIYAAAWSHTGAHWPLVWAPEYLDATAYDVTPFYTSREPVEIAIYDKPAGKPASAAITIHWQDELVAAAPSASHFQFDLARGQKYTVELKPADGAVVKREFTLPAEKAERQSLFLGQ